MKILVQPQANSVFAELPPKWIESLRADGWRFYVFIAQGGCRFMCSWDTTEDDVQALDPSFYDEVWRAAAHAYGLAEAERQIAYALHNLRIDLRAPASPDGA